MNVSDAVYHTVHDYPGGAAALGPRMGIREQVLNSKVNPRITTHRTYIEEADALVGLTGDIRIIQSLAAHHGLGVYHLDDAPDGVASMTAALLKQRVADGDLARILNDALADGRISMRECEQITRAGQDLQTAIIALLHHVRSLAAVA